MLVIHIGTHKTGTSALQAFFGNRADELDTRGVHYLRSGRAAGKAHHELSWGIRERHGADVSAWDAVRAELKANAQATQIISSEAFWFTDPAGVKAQLGEVKDLRIVMYLRRQDKYLQSLYKQTVAGGRRISFQQWREKFHFRGDYLSVVRQWADAFGKDALVIRPYERGGKTIDVVADFLSFLGVDAAGEFQRKKAGRNNPSPRRELMELIRAFNQLDVDVDRDKFFYEVVSRNEAYIRSADLLTFEECASLVEEFADGNRTLVSEFYTGSEPLFPEMTRGEPPVIWPPDSEEYFAMLVDVLDAVWKAARKEKADESGEPRMKKKRKRSAKP